MLLIALVTLAVIFFTAQISSLSTTIYLHRTMAHKGIKLHPLAAMAFQFQLWVFTGIVTREWVAVHRKHHHFTDEEGDPHSPYLKGLWPVLLWNAVYYSREANKAEVVEKYTRDIPRGRAEALLSRGWLGLVLGGSLFAAGFGLWLGGWIGAVFGVGVFLAQGMFYIVLNALINGACHAIGYKNFKNTATNIRLVAWLTAGEGLHNNHHQFPASAKLAMNPQRWEFDPAWPVIKLLSLLKLARPMPLPRVDFGAPALEMPLQEQTAGD